MIVQNISQNLHGCYPLLKLIVMQYSALIAFISHMKVLRTCMGSSSGMHFCFVLCFCSRCPAKISELVYRVFIITTLLPISTNAKASKCLSLTCIKPKDSSFSVTLRVFRELGWAVIFIKIHDVCELLNGVHYLANLK